MQEFKFGSGEALRPAATGAAKGAGLKAGAAKVDITNREAGPVNDPLYVKALVIDDGAMAVVIITVDAVAIAEIGSIKNDYLAKVRSQLQKELNLIQLNVTSTVHLAKYVVRDMLSRGSGRILFTSSIAGTMPTPLEAVYGASKAFVLSFSQSLHHELKDTGVTVTALQPGPTDTNFFHRAGMDDTKVGSEGKYTNDPAEVAQQGYDALMASEDHVFASSMKTKVQGELGKFMPESVKAKMHEKQAEPKSKQG